MKLDPESWDYGISGEVAQTMARKIHDAVVRMHLRAIGHETAGGREEERKRIQAVRSLLRTCESRKERRHWVCLIRIFFHELREKHGTDVRWQNYVARVVQARGGAL